MQVRPTEVTILAVLEGLGGIGYLALTAVFMGLRMYLGIFSAFLGFIGVIFLIMGVLSFVFAWGLWSGKGWAWTLTLIFTVLGALIGLITIPVGIISLVIDGIMLYYLTRPHVKQFFGKAVVAPPSSPPTSSGIKLPIIMQKETIKEIEVVYCSHCGTKNNAHSPFCAHCGAPLH